MNANATVKNIVVGCDHAACDLKAKVIGHLKENGYTVTDVGTYSSDSSSFAGAGVPACSFARLSPRGGAEIHNHNDVMDRLDPDSFMITINFVSKLAEGIVNAPVNPIPRKLADSVVEKLEKGKKMMMAAEEAKKKEAEEAEKAKEAADESKEAEAATEEKK